MLDQLHNAHAARLAMIAQADAEYAKALHDIDARFGAEVARLLDGTATPGAPDAAPTEDEATTERRPAGWKNTLHSLGWSDADRDAMSAAEVRTICRERLRKGERPAENAAK